MELDKHIKYIERLQKDINPEKEPGFSAAVIQEGEVIFELHHGLASMENQSPLTADSLYYLASVSKQFTAACILNLVHNKQLKLNQDVREIIKETRHFSPKISIQHLLHHTSGIPEYFEYLNCQLGDRHDSDYFDNRDILTLISRMEDVSFAPSEKFHYSNSNYILLAEVVKKISGLKISSYAKKYIFSPLGMKDTIFDDDRYKVVKNRVSSYDSPSTKSSKYFVYLKNSCTIGDGGMLSSISDLMKWESEFHNKPILPAYVINSLTKEGKLTNGDTTAYGNGTELSTKQNKYKFSYHGGSFEGFLTHVLRVPSHKLSLIFLSNNGSINCSVNWHVKNF